MNEAEIEDNGLFCSASTGMRGSRGRRAAARWSRGAAADGVWEQGAEPSGRGGSRRWWEVGWAFSVFRVGVQHRVLQNGSGPYRGEG